jgi:hypothetical protein
MKASTVAALIALAALGLAVIEVFAADDSKVKSATRQVESGAKKIGDGKLGQGVEEAAKGIGKTVVEGAKYTGEKLKESGKAAEKPAKNAWENTKDAADSFWENTQEAAASFWTGVRNFFSRLFSG